jgi:hypothetical protein
LLIACLLGAGITSGCSDDEPESAPKRDAGADVSADTAGEADTRAADASDTSGSEDTDTTASPAQLRVLPSQIFFEDVEIGESVTASLSLANIGGSTLFVTDAIVTERAADASGELKPSDTWIGDSVKIEPGTHTSIEVLYEPDDSATDRGFVTITSTDPENTTVVVPIETVNAYPDIDVLRTLRFGSVAVGDPDTRSVVIHNRGIAPLQVNEISLADTSDPTFSVAMQSPYETPAVIQKDDYIIFDVTYAPSDTDTDLATIVVDSEDPDQGTVEIGVAGNEPSPCIQVVPTNIDFGAVAVGDPKIEDLTLLNCSETRSLEVSEITLTTAGGGAFSINQAPSTPVTIAPRSTELVQISARGDAERDAVGVLVVESNDPQQGAVVVDLRAQFVAQ